MKINTVEAPDFVKDRTQTVATLRKPIVTPDVSLPSVVTIVARYAELLTGGPAEQWQGDKYVKLGALPSDLRERVLLFLQSERMPLLSCMRFKLSALKEYVRLQLSEAPINARISITPHVEQKRETWIVSARQLNDDGSEAEDWIKYAVFSSRHSAERYVDVELPTVIGDVKYEAKVESGPTVLSTDAVNVSAKVSHFGSTGRAASYL